MTLRNYIANHAAFLGRPKRFLSAFLGICVLRSSYSQHGEDATIRKYLHKPEAYDIGYIDIGANHPTKISNTFLLYRAGYKGFLIEPNRELAHLCRLFRPRDVTLQIGIARDASVKTFMVSTTPTISSFSGDHFSRRNQALLRKDYVPVMSLNCAFGEITGRVGLISIDVEGMNREVLVSGLATIKRSHVVCIEHDSPGEAREIRITLEDIGFVLVEVIGCNQIFVNQGF